MRLGLKIFALCLCASAAEDSKHDRQSARYLWVIFYNSVLTVIGKASPGYSTPPILSFPHPLTLLYPRHPSIRFSPLANATVSPNDSWYRPNPNTYQNTTVITIERARTNITLRFSNGSITVNATQKELTTVTSDGQGYIVFNNTIPSFANRDVNFAVDDVIYTNKTANASGFLSFNYTNFMASGSMHTFKWALNVPGYDINQDGIVNILDLNYIGQHYGEVTSSPYPAYDVDQNGIVDSDDMLIVLLHFGDITG